MVLFDGLKEAKKLEKVISLKACTHKDLGSMGIIQIGDDPISEKYIKSKLRVAKKLGINIELYRINSLLTDSIIVREVMGVFHDDKIRGVIVQLPLPRESLKKVINLIPLDKDIDLLSDKSLSQFAQKKTSRSSPAIRALNHFLVANKIKTEGLAVTLVGGGRLVGRPISYFLLQGGAKITILDERLNQKEFYSSYDGIKIAGNYKSGEDIIGDLVILGTNKPHLVNGENLRKGTHLVDFGANVYEGGITGNFDNNSQTEHLGAASLAPGGMGPLVMRYLLLNFLET